MVGFSGTTPPQSLLQRIQNGTVGGVILFSANVQSILQTRTLTNQLRGAARAGGNPPLLIAVDQEGGSIRRFSSASPDLSPPQMAASGNPSVALKEGKKTGRALSSAGVNVDLAPVVDVATSPQSFIARQGRSFGGNPDTVASFADQFTKGLQRAGVLATAKHFPGVGSAAVDTDNKLETINASRKDLDAALRPYRHLAQSGVDMVMLSTAIFPAYDSSAPAALSRPVQQLLRRDVGFQGVTITDALESPTGMSTAKAGVTAAKSGVDIVLFTNDATAESAALRDAAGRGDVSRKNLESSYKRIAALKQSLKP